MNKIFIFCKNRQFVHNDYVNEINSAYKIFQNEKNLKFISYKNLRKISFTNYQIIIFNYLPKILIKDLSKQKKILIKINQFDPKDKYIDLFIDKRLKKAKPGLRVMRETISYNKNNNINFKKILNVINLLNWDTNFWGFKIASLDAYILTKNIIFQLKNFIKKNNIKLIQFMANFHNTETTYLAENNKFEFKDIRCLLSINLDKYKKKTNTFKNSKIKLIKGKINHYKSIYQSLNNTYSDSRYFFDNNFSKRKVIKF